MKKVIAALLTATLVTLASLQPAHASKVGTSNKFGIGGMLGAPTGLSMKYFFHKQHAIDIGIGFGWFGHASLFIHVDYKFHIYLTKNQHFELPLYFGVGPKLFIWFHDHCHYYWGGKAHCRDGYIGFGVRVPIGVAFHFNKVPLDVFLEIVPGVGFFPWFGMFLDGAVGVRYYF